MLRNCLKSNGWRPSIEIKCGCEDPNLSNGLERQPMGDYPALDSTGQIRWTAAHAGDADGRQCNSVSSCWWHPVANAAERLSELAKRLLLLSLLAQGWH